ncbi:MAG: type I secretion system permease/ATPase [Rhodobacterales bacterium]|nr:type I secretion system permease/ATPase [Rhodobacterales bacterium]
MATPDDRRGRAELRAALGRSTGLFVVAFVFSCFVNLLMLTGPLYMLQVYDRVLGSRSEETLVALSALVAGLFLAMGLLDHARARLLGRIGARFQAGLDSRVFSAALRRSAGQPNDSAAVAAQRDLESVQRFLTSPVLAALLDMPWAPMFLAAIYVFHPLLGWLALAGGVVLIVLTMINRLATRAPLHEATMATLQADRMSEQLKAEAEVMQALGMMPAGFARWNRLRAEALVKSIAAADRTGGFAVASKTFRMALQSAILGAGAWLSLRGEITSGAMIAASILAGRALAPVEQAIGQWATVTRAQEGWARLVQLLSIVPAGVPRTALPRPRALLEVQQLSVIPPGQSTASLRMVSFRLEPGQAMGVIGPSGSGKSTLARALTGVWPAAAGRIRLDGATLDQYDPEVLGRLIGYLPQQVTLFDGTIADNIARLDPAPDAEAVVHAARRAGAHEMILKLPQGYDTRVSALGGMLSGGQIQRVGLARALYGDPVLLILDEPNSNLDNEGSVALNGAIRAAKEAGHAVLIMAHRPAAIQECDLLLMLAEGTRRAFGPRDQILREMVRNQAEITRSATPGGVT